MGLLVFEPFLPMCRASVRSVARKMPRLSRRRDPLGALWSRTGTEFDEGSAEMESTSTRWDRRSVGQALAMGESFGRSKSREPDGDD